MQTTGFYSHLVLSRHSFAQLMDRNYPAMMKKRYVTFNLLMHCPIGSDFNLTGWNGKQELVARRLCVMYGGCIIGRQSPIPILSNALPALKQHHKLTIIEARDSVPIHAQVDTRMCYKPLPAHCFIRCRAVSFRTN